MSITPLFEVGYGTWIEASIPEGQLESLTKNPEDYTRLAAEAAPKDILFNFETLEFVIEKGDLALAKSHKYIQQSIKIRLQFIFEEWFANLDLGVPYFERIFVRAPSFLSIKEIFLIAIKSAQGVVKVNDFNFDFDPETRKLSVTDWDVIADTTYLSEGVV